MVPVSAGSFPYQKEFVVDPNKWIHVNNFYIGKYEVTNQEYYLYLKSAIFEGSIYENNKISYSVDGNKPLFNTYDYEPASKIVYYENEFILLPDMNNYPVVMVSWFRAAAYCNWLSIQENLTPCYEQISWECNY